MKIKNTKVYGLEHSVIRSGYPMTVGEVDNIDQLSKSKITSSFMRAKKLSKLSGGHNNFLKGIIVQFDLKYPQYMSQQLQRYNFVDIISSQSKMHRIHQIKDFKQHCNEFVLPGAISTINRLITLYNEAVYPTIVWKGEVNYINTEIIAHDRKELFHIIISNIPMGFELWMGVSTNYLQLRNIYKQRNNHKLKDWKEFTKWISSLPHNYLIKD